jgi:protocatechuate 3,4-dioxygenase beta subunit
MKNKWNIFIVLALFLFNIPFFDSAKSVDVSIPIHTQNDSVLNSVSSLAQPVTMNCGFPSGTASSTGNGSISGTIQDAETLQPLAGVRIYVCGYRRGNVNQYGYDVYGEGVALTTETGSFALTNLPVFTNQGPLFYSIVVIPNEINQKDYEILPLTNVQITESSNFTISLRKGAILKGKVIDEHTGAPLAGVKVWATFEAYPVPFRSGILFISTVTDSFGNYTFSNLSSTTYGLLFEPQNPAYVWEAYPGVPNYVNDFFFSQPLQRIDARVGTTVEVNASLQRYAVIGGQITTTIAGTPLTDAFVRVIPRDPALYFPFGERNYTTDKEGRFSALVPTGSYWIFVKPPMSSDYPCQFYLSQQDPETYPASVSIVQPEVRLNVNQTLLLPGKITGIIRYASGRPVTDAVLSENWLPDPECNTFNADYFTDEQGRFEINNLVPRTYKLNARNSRYIYKHQEVIVRPGEAVSNVEFIFPDPIYLPLVRSIMAK